MIAVSIPFSVTAAESDIEFKAQLFGFPSCCETLETGKTYVFDSHEETQEFINKLYSDEHTESETKLRDYCNALPKSFYNEKSLIVITVYTPELGYDMTALTVVKDQNEIKIDATLYGGGPCVPEFFTIVIEVNKSDLAGTDSVKANVDVKSHDGIDPDGIEYEARFFELGHFPIEPASDGFYEMPDVFVLNTPETLDEFLKIEFSDAYNAPYFSDYLNGIMDDFFDSKSVLIGIFETGLPNHNFTKASVGKKNGVMSIECEHTVELGMFPTVCGYYAVVIELDSAYLWDVEEIEATKKDVTEYPKLDYSARIIDGYISEENLKQYASDGYPMPIIVDSNDKLSNLLSACESEGLTKWTDGLSEDYFDSKAFVAIYQEFDYTNVTYRIDGIIDNIEGDGLNWIISIRGDQYDRVKGKDSKLFIFEIDKEYAGSNFFYSFRKTNIKGDVLCNGTEFVETMDYIALKRFYFGTYKLTKQQQRLGDINENGEIDSMDYVLLKRAYFGTYEI